MHFPAEFLNVPRMQRHPATHLSVIAGRGDAQVFWLSPWHRENSSPDGQTIGLDASQETVNK
jgi:hypothetical protein